MAANRLSLDKNCIGRTGINLNGCLSLIHGPENSFNPPPATTFTTCAPGATRVSSQSGSRKAKTRSVAGTLRVGEVRSLNYAISFRTDCGTELAWANIAVPACTRMFDFANMVLSSATSTSLMRLFAAVRLSRRTAFWSL